MSEEVWVTPFIIAKQKQRKLNLGYINSIKMNLDKLIVVLSMQQNIVKQNIAYMNYIKLGWFKNIAMKINF